MNDSVKKLKIIIAVLASMALILLSVLGYREYILRSERGESIQMKTYLEGEKDSLRKELLYIRDQYDSLQTDNDTMQLQLSVQKEYINKLLKVRKDALWEISLYKKELTTLRSVLKDFVKQIDSLNTLNQALLSENKDVKEKLTKSETEASELKQIKEELSSKVEKAEVLSAKSITPVGLNKKSKEKFDVENIEKLRVCFTLRENAIATAGKRWVYLRIIRPDDVVLTKNEENIYNMKGNNLVFTDKREIDYQNQDIEMCIFYAVNKGELIPGDYKIILLSEGAVVGETVLTIKPTKGFFNF